ncbi:MAG: PEP-CTERM sorting domain-containing protein, partial [Bryobacteraceae bacterium]
PGAAIPTFSGAHLNLPNGLMLSSIGPGIRRIASEADILANAQISQSTDFQLNPTGVPEPATWMLLSSGLALLFTVRRRNGIHS